MKVPQIELHIDKDDSYKFIKIYCTEQTLAQVIDVGYVRCLGVEFKIYLNYISIINDNLQEHDYWQFLVEYFTKAFEQSLTSNPFKEVDAHKTPS